MTSDDTTSNTTHDYPDTPLGVPETSALFGVSVSTLRRMLAAGKLPNATKRKGPKGDEWVIPPADMVAAGYSVGGPVPVPVTPNADLEAMRADYERRLTELRATHQVEVEGIRATHRAEVETLTQRADYERQLREAQGQTLNVLTALVSQTRAGRRALARSGQLELEAPKKQRRGWSRKQSDTEAPK